jgi:hypothetical protein
MTTLITGVLFAKQQRLEAVVRDAGGKYRRIVITWESKEPSGLPSNWLKMVELETELQRSAEADKASGRQLIP